MEIPVAGSAITNLKYSGLCNRHLKGKIFRSKIWVEFEGHLLMVGIHGDEKAGLFF
jgi:hypothetical protein